MTSRDFCYWLQGFFEIEEPGDNPVRQSLNPKQVDTIRRHLAMVFVHDIDPQAGGLEVQKKLNEIHWPTNQSTVIARC